MSRGRQRANLESRGNEYSNKTFSRGFGIVRMLTSATQQRVFDALHEADISHQSLRRRDPLHATVIGFVGMSKREQTAFHAGFSVARLEEKFEDAVEDDVPRRALTVELGDVCVMGGVVYCEIDAPVLHDEQLKLAGQVALHGISINRIRKRIVPPHMTVGFNGKTPIEETRQLVEEALVGQTVALERWRVYPNRYA